ncbi:hypothetical protein GF352_01180 [archaeon]|nr:hypothetical protein [archaeon]
MELKQVIELIQQTETINDIYHKLQEILEHNLADTKYFEDMKNFGFRVKEKSKDFFENNLIMPLGVIENVI